MKNAKIIVVLALLTLFLSGCANVDRSEVSAPSSQEMVAIEHAQSTVPQESITVLSGAGFSALIEVSQLLTTRATDIDDLIANTLGTAVGFAVWFAFAKLFGQRMKTTVDGSKEAWIYIAISFCGMFFLHYPFWFAFKVAPLIWH